MGTKQILSKVARRARSLMTEGQPADTRGTYLALERYRGRVGDSLLGATSLTPYEMKLFSQNGEDGVIAELFQRIGTTNKFFVEFGIQTGVEGNSIALADVLGWSGVFIEPDPIAFSLLEQKFAGADHVMTWKQFVTPSNINEIFRHPKVPAEPDLLSIDIDGGDIWVWSALEVLRPRVVIIEYNGALPLDATIAQASDSIEQFDGVTFGSSSLGALDVVAAAKGYRLVYTDLAGVNAFYVREDLFDLVGVSWVPRRCANYWLSGVRWKLADLRWVDVGDGVDG